MSRLANFFAPQEFYHLYNRGTDKRLIFLDNNDRDRFLTLLYLCNNKSPVHRSDFINISIADLLTIPRKEVLVDIGVYCLMPNHFHLLVHEYIENGISTFMQKLSTAYTMYFNKCHERSGSLFQGRFKAEHLDNDNYLKYIYSYVHLNPVSIIDSSWKKHKLKDKLMVNKYLNSYQFSSYLDYVNESPRFPEGNILNPSAFPNYFRSPKDFRANIQEWINLANENVKVEP